MTRALLLAAAAALSATAASAQTPTVTLFELPGYLGRSVTLSADAPDLAAQLRARSARVTGSWQFCPQASYAGTCRTVTANQPLLNPVPLSIRTSASATATPATTAAGTTATASANASVDLASLDAGGGTEGQDVTFFARPSLSGSEVSAGTNDLAAATAFCKLAGATSASAAGRARVQASNLIDATAATRVRGFALRDVVCRR